MIEPINISTEGLKNQRIIYIQFRGSYVKFRRKSKKLFNFATTNNLIDQNKSKILTIYDDKPFITDEKNLRTSVVMTIPTDEKVIERGNICESSIYGKTWQYMYKD